MFERFLGTVDEALSFHTYPVLDGCFPSDHRESDAWLVTGSSHGVYDRLPWIQRLEQLLRRLHDEDEAPIVGICFGHQILAQALGGSVERSTRGWGLGVHTYRIYRRPTWLTGPSDRFSIHAVHQDQVVDPPRAAEIIAGSEFCPYGVLSYGERTISFQGHPEFSPSYERDLLNLRRGNPYPEEVVDAAIETLGTPTDSRRVAEWIVGFLRKSAR